MIEWIGLLAAGALIGALCYRAGLREGRRTDARRPPAVPAAPARPAVACAGLRDEESRRFARILANIDAYDGTDRGQREV